MRPTAEQQAICESRAGVLKIRAGAGTGKTTTLRGLAARSPRCRILYLAFNRAIKDEAQGKFGPHVRAMTAHGLAFAQVGRFYADVPGKLASGDIKPFHVLPLLADRIKGIPKSAHNLYGGRVIETVKAFLVSADSEMLPVHVAHGGSPVEVRHFQPEDVLASARLVWERMQDLTAETPMIHDGYLKLFHLKKPALPYDVILLDEAQDTNPVTLDLVSTQNARRVYVGDEHQAIYGFRGAFNAMAFLEADAEYTLTGSFRFGPEIAGVANAILSSKGEAMQLQGLGRPGGVGTLPPKAPHAFIARGNSALFSHAVHCMERQESFAFVGPLYNYRFDLLTQTYLLSTGQSVSDPFLKAFTHYGQLEEYASTLGDREVMGRCGVVNKYGARIPALIQRLEAVAQTHPGCGAVQTILTSAHRSKGLEFPCVRLADDFRDFFDDETGLPRDMSQADAADHEEINLHYVASTRAQTSLEVGEKLQEWLDHHKASASSPRAGRVSP